MFGILRTSPFVNHKGKDVISDWLAGQWDERNVLGHAQINKRRIKGDDPDIATVQTLKRFDGRLALQEKIRKTFADSIPNNYWRKNTLAKGIIAYVQPITKEKIGLRNATHFCAVRASAFIR